MSDPNRGAFGEGKFGGDAEAFFGAVGPFAIDFAYPTSETSIRVGLTREPQHDSPFLSGDVYNPETWELTRLDPGGVRTNLYVYGVREFSPPLVWDLFCLKRLGSYVVSHRILTTTLQTRAGQRIGLPRQMDFLGVVNVNHLDPLPSTQGVVDYRNRSLLDDKALHIGTRGLYEIEAKKEALKKRLIRILITEPGSWPGDPLFGVGFKEKEPLPDSDVRSLQRKIEEQFLRDPEVGGAKVTLELDDIAGVVSIMAYVQAKFTADAVPFRHDVPVMF